MKDIGYVPFSMMGKTQKEKIDRAIDRSMVVMDTILDAPMAAKENLMRTDFKVAASTLGFVGRLLQAESAMVQAVTVLADRAQKSVKFRQIVSRNLPHVKLLPKALPAAKK